MRKFNIKKLFAIKKILEQAPWFLARHAFLIILLLAFLSVAIGGILIYNYVILIENRPLGVDYGLIKFNEVVYKNVLLKWQFSNEGYEQSEQSELQSPFTE